MIGFYVLASGAIQAIMALSFISLQEILFHVTLEALGVYYLKALGTICSIISYIMKAIGRGENTGILREIRQKILETKDMDRDTKFLVNI